ncbi:YqhR family membrane protein [Cohnella boryungensis]|uniref:YqhR family membrane protein n=1 Tax=Cohnella boryungensis TaxID=768479 RepID=A0ABV8S6V8_9BACL
MTTENTGNAAARHSHSAASEQRGSAHANEPAPTRPVPFSIKIGFFAGLIWGLARWLAAGLHLTNVSQAFLLDPFVPRKLLGGLYWQAAGLVAFIVMSMLAALIYLGILRRLRGPWPGLWFGAGWWGLLYAWAGPYIGALPPLKRIGGNSMATDLCLFLMWGLFIGYSIAFELHDEANREPTKPSGTGSPQPAV